MNTFRKLTWKERISGQCLVYNPAADLPILSTAELAMWRSSQPHVEFARQLMIQPKFRELLGVLSNLRPSEPMRSHEITPHQATMLYGIRKGFDAVIATIRLCAEPIVAQQEEPVADYGASDTEWANVIEEEQ